MNNNNPIPLRVPDIEIEPLEWPCKTDILYRHNEIENISRIALNTAAPAVLAINDDWGTGKTTFIKLWQHYLETQNNISLYINAWENDFSDDPLLPILSEVDDWLSKINDTTISKLAWHKAKKIIPKMLKTSVIVSAKVGTLGALELDKEYEKIISDAAGQSASSIFESFKSNKNVLKQFKGLLSKTLKSLPDDQNNLIIFIDELDRCKPTYAVEMLERIKHLFDIDQIVFVLAINRDQLSKSIQGVYGATFDGDNYLNRFIDHEHKITVPSAKEYYLILFNKDSIQNVYLNRKDGENEKKAVNTMFEIVLERFNYTLRELNQVMTRFNLAINCIPNNQECHAVLLVTLIILRSKNHDLYIKYINSIYYANDVIKFLLGDIVTIINSNYSFGYVCSMIIHAGANDGEYYNNNRDFLLKQWLNQADKHKEDNRISTQINIILSTSLYGDTSRINIRKRTSNYLELTNTISIE